MDGATLYYDPDGGMVEVAFGGAEPGFYAPSDDDRLMWRVAADGRILGFRLETGGRVALPDPAVTPQEFYAEFAGRPDVRAILSRLAE